MPAPTVIIWFRQDLRLADHPALSTAVKTGGAVIPLYILDDETPGDRCLGGASRWWLAHSLARLSDALEAKDSRLILRQGRAENVLIDFASRTGAAAIHVTTMVEPWAAELDRRLETTLARHGVTYNVHPGSMLFQPGSLRTEGGNAFRVYTPFARAAFKSEPPKRPLAVPAALPSPSCWPESDALAKWDLLPTRPDWARGLHETWIGKTAASAPGETGARIRFKRFLSNALKQYATDRDLPGIEGTSRLSPHLHFGEISPGTIWWTVRTWADAHGGVDAGVEKFLKEVLWREFSHHLLAVIPTLPDEPFRAPFAKFPWLRDGAAFQAWSEGRTGYPIVDAGMRELWTTGYMHNRVRLITASFLVKHLLIPWQDGERWFWDTLVDADLANNAANWQWVAGCGTDSAPYFRIFNPMLQGAKFDPEGDYVRRWVPELSRLPNAHLHAPFMAPATLLTEAGVELGKTYPRPIVDHAAARQRALDAFDQIKAH
jgi:deoxyribodipyrimidine photo-lyase